MTENPVLAAMEAYKRAHPHREDEIEAAFASYDPNATETPAVEELPQAIPPPEAPEQEPLPLPTDMDRPEWA